MKSYKCKITHWSNALRKVSCFLLLMVFGLHVNAKSTQLDAGGEQYENIRQLAYKNPRKALEILMLKSDSLYTTTDTLSFLRTQALIYSRDDKTEQAKKTLETLDSIVVKK